MTFLTTMFGSAKNITNKLKQSTNKEKPKMPTLHSPSNYVHTITNYMHTCDKCGDTNVAARDQVPHLNHWIYRIWGVERKTGSIKMIGWVWRFSSKKFAAYGFNGINLYWGTSLCRALSRIRFQENALMDYEVPKNQKFLQELFERL